MNVKVEGAPAQFTVRVEPSTSTEVTVVTSAASNAPVRRTAYDRPAFSAATVSPSDVDGALIMFHAAAVRRGSVTSCVSSFAMPHTARPADSAVSHYTAAANVYFIFFRGSQPV